MFNRKYGFTLIEVIVVGVIITVLAAVAIPIYNGYMKDTRQKNVETLATAAAASASIYKRKYDSHPPDLASLNIFNFDSSVHTYDIDSNNSRIIIADTTVSSSTIADTVSY
ncbi:MAG: prepilin-type N-terminal cleavage/methylation domain-containing protein [Chitinivibrionales bacterium]|nr:prepilin-type N-terminal cleavage/methylation domain-containing protein [Chitinivibrionales bacterium]